ncbi:MAG: hypothetical protein IPG90_15550 [Bacteroidetes bacterium]|nr:hypothetical protein [Bacteroidota bacterium]
MKGQLTAYKHAQWKELVATCCINMEPQILSLFNFPFGINFPWSQFIGVTRDIYFGQCAFSPDGNYYAYYRPYGDLDIFSLIDVQDYFRPWHIFILMILLLLVV